MPPSLLTLKSVAPLRQSATELDKTAYAYVSPTAHLMPDTHEHRTSATSQTVQFPESGANDRRQQPESRPGEKIAGADTPHGRLLLYKSWHPCLPCNWLQTDLARKQCVGMVDRGHSSWLVTVFPFEISKEVSPLFLTYHHPLIYSPTLPSGPGTLYP